MILEEFMHSDLVKQRLLEITATTGPVTDAVRIAHALYTQVRPSIDSPRSADRSYDPQSLKRAFSVLGAVYIGRVPIRSVRKIFARMSGYKSVYEVPASEALRELKTCGDSRIKGLVTDATLVLPTAFAHDVPLAPKTIYIIAVNSEDRDPRIDYDANSARTSILVAICPEEK